MDWYDAQRFGLGDQLLDAVALATSSLDVFPRRGPVVFDDARRLLLPSFPYALYYRVIGSIVEVRGCLHHRRAPAVSRARR